MSTIEQTLNAGVPVTFPGGEQFHLLEAVNPVDITFYDSRNKPMETWEAMKGGFRIVFEKGFIQVRLESATGQTVKIGITSGRGEYDRSQGDVTADLTKALTYYSLVDYTIAPGLFVCMVTNAKRRVAYISSLSTNITALRITNTLGTANRGTPLSPGETITIKAVGPIYVFNAAGINQIVALSYTED